ncbi:MAG: hypothetical protein HY880_06735 [Deltaproteobacteria bacterium]|nr:hypothetical protein [Deltaproteobacteria bacterium]
MLKYIAGVHISDGEIIRGRYDSKNKDFAVLLILVAFVFTCPAFAEIRTFEKEVEEIVGRDQSQEQVEAFALQKAKRLAVEEAGTYISSFTVVQNF